MASRSVMEHNRTVLKSLKEGDLVEFPRELYAHWAVFVGGEKLIHFDGKMEENVGWGTVFGERYKEASVKYGNFFDVTGQYEARKNNDKDKIYKPLSAEDIVREATSKVGLSIGYDLISHNCEHFANFCRYGVEISDQADRAIRLAEDVGNRALDYMFRPSKKSDKTY